MEIFSVVINLSALNVSNQKYNLIIQKLKGYASNNNSKILI